MLSNGVDIIDIRRIRRALDRFGDRFLKRVYTDAEIVVCRRNVEALAARFSGKEAVMKTLGLRYLPWKDIEILPDPRGKPLVTLHGQAKMRSDELKLGEIAISLSHEKEYAMSSAVAQVIG
jgi:holo-[acyl-carrier protein] synthase